MREHDIDGFSIHLLGCSIISVHHKRFVSIHLACNSVTILASSNVRDDPLRHLLAQYLLLCQDSFLFQEILRIA